MARDLDTAAKVVFGILMYSRKQLLVHLPRAWISHLGWPAAAAVDAAPILNEWEDMFWVPGGLIRARTAARPDLVRYRPSCHMKRGPGFCCRRLR